MNKKMILLGFVVLALISVVVYDQLVFSNCPDPLVKTQFLEFGVDENLSPIFGMRVVEGEPNYKLIAISWETHSDTIPDLAKEIDPINLVVGDASLVHLSMDELMNQTDGEINLEEFPDSTFYLSFEKESNGCEYNHKLFDYINKQVVE